MVEAFHSQREAALALLNSDYDMGAVDGCFLADIAVGHHSDRTDELRGWISKLLQQAGLPPLTQAKDGMSHRHSDTSAAAYLSIVPVSRHLRAIVYRTLHANPRGLTVDETCAIAKYPRYSLQPRFTELRDQRVITDTGMRRRNVSGAKAIVWKVVDQQERPA